MTVVELDSPTRVVGLRNGNKALGGQKLGVSRPRLSRRLSDPMLQ